MKSTLLSIVILLTLSSALGQYSCKDAHQSGTSDNWYKSAFDNLRSDTVDVLNYDIFLDFTQMGSQIIKGSNTVSFEALENISTVSFDLLQMTVDSVVHSSGPLAYSYNDTLLVINLPTSMNVNDEDSLTIYYQGSPEQDATGWGGFYFQGAYAFNLGVGFGADPHNYGRVWHPCFDNFAERATYDFTILTNNARTAYCNGELLGTTTVGTDSLLTYWNMPDEIPSYLANVAVSNYTHAELEHVSQLTGDTIPIWLIAQPADTSDAKSSFANIFSCLDTYESSYGQHVWNKVGFVMVPFSSGAMEHATNICYPLITANGSLLYETLMAHELAHHWWGDLVTCTTEEEMWINEGMASYSEKLFLEGRYGYDVYMAEVRNNHHDVLHLAHVIDSGYYALNAVPHAYTYGEHSYNKGADVAHTLRGYMGDSLFFAGLASTINSFAGGNLSSTDFMAHLNSLSGIDVTDFFNDWIFSPGFAGYSIVDYTVSGTGPYTVDVVVDQKLRGASAYHSNVPLTVSFMADNWSIHEESITMNGSFDLFSFNVPFDPVLVAVNMDEKINDAVTASNVVITSTGLKDVPYANSRVSVTAVTDSAFIRFEHHWVHPDAPSVPSGIQISSERYWDIKGIDVENINGTMRFEFNGQNNNSGYYDNQLLVDLGGQPFHEDSIVLLYRPDSQSPWAEHTSYTINTTGSATDKKGFANTTNILMGQYAWGYKTNSVGINTTNNENVFSIYPNPNQGAVNIKLKQPNIQSYTMRVFGADGKECYQENVFSALYQADLSHLEDGLYTIQISANGSFIGAEQVIITK